MTKWNDKQRVTAVCVAGVLLGGLAGFGIWWANGLVEEERGRIETAQAAIKTAELSIAKIPTIEDDVITLRENVGEYVKILPDDDYINNFIRRTEEFLQHSGVRINSIKPGSPNKRGKFDQFSYSISLEGTLWQFLKFVNEFENYERFVRVTRFSLKSGDGKKDQMIGGNVMHKITMTVETFVYRGASQGKNVNIPNYAGKRNKLREKILANALSIKLRHYEYRGAQGRRDIFLDPRQSSSAINVDNPIEKQKAHIARYSSEVQAAREVFERIQDDRLTYLERARLEKSLETRLGELRAAIADTSSREVITWPPFRLKWNNEVVKPVEQILTQVDEQPVGPDPQLALAQLETLYDSMRTRMADGDLSGVKEEYSSFQDKLDVDPEDERYAVVEKIEMLMLYVDAIAAFSQVPLKIAGVVVHGDGRSGLLVNGSVFEEGEYIDEDLVLSRVESESAEFLFRGFTIVKSW